MTRDKFIDVVEFFGIALTLTLLQVLSIPFAVSLVIDAFHVEGWWSLLVLFASFFVLLLWIIIAMWLWVNVSSEYFGAYILYRKLLDDTSPGPNDGGFVERPDLSSKIKDVLAERDPRVLIVYGSRGYGKTSLIRNALKGRRGTISIELDEYTTEYQAKAKIMSCIPFPYELFGAYPDDDDDDEYFFHRLLDVCPVTPVVYVPMGTDTTGEALNRTLTTFTNWVLGPNVKFIIDLSSIRSISDCRDFRYFMMRDHHIITLCVGPLSHTEAEMYITKQLSTIFDDRDLRVSAKKLILHGVDHDLVAVRRVCNVLRERQPTGVELVKEILKEIQGEEKKKALDGWKHFQTRVVEKLGGEVDSSEIHRRLVKTVDLFFKDSRPKRFDVVATLHGHNLNGPTYYNNSDSDIVPWWNEEAEHRQPFNIQPGDPYHMIYSRLKMSINGRAMREVFRDYMVANSVFSMYKHYELPVHAICRFATTTTTTNNNNKHNNKYRPSDDDVISQVEQKDFVTSEIVHSFLFFFVLFFHAGSELLSYCKVGSGLQWQTNQRMPPPPKGKRFGFDWLPGPGQGGRNCQVRQTGSK